ncbi:hypothetical protein PT140_04755 (plasmid) [Borreliella garinii]|nr:hypothetical protein PT139_04755 [Borreliella garinii]WNZ68157.1 hypothetical protein PT135_04765 [Borreliella garinii]WNZ69155.1 hypothetical protein PT138_04775 [Borreliella garinii]WNZ70156.1 hypothetical protein PT140_04755 [Borreliella garinii]WNZ71159.1 hypothetical protein PT141_04775 [Borreliella garinii]
MKTNFITFVSPSVEKKAKCLKRY